YMDFQTPWSPDGERFTTAQMDGSLHFWETSSVKELLNLSTEEEEPGATWSPAGDIILTSNVYINELTARDAASGEIKYTLDMSDYALPVFGDWSPSGDRFSIREFDRVRIFDTASGSLLQEFNVPGVRISVVRFSHDGTQIITSGREDGTARLWDLQTGELQGAIGGLVQAQGIAWSPSDDLVAISGGGGIHIWDPEFNAEKELLPILAADVFLPEWTPDGKQIIVPSFISSEIRVFNLSQALYTFSGLSDFTGFAAWSP
ncbi:unnamed protein product, partial [marine sediment metagenome]